jgi:hypothetical protein
VEVLARKFFSTDVVTIDPTPIVLEPESRSSSARRGWWDLGREFLQLMPRSSTH